MTIDLTPTEPQCIGIVGLGLVGRALAGRLRSAGYECIGFDLQHDAMDSFVALGFRTEASLPHLAALSNIFLLTVFETAGAMQVIDEILHSQNSDGSENTALRQTSLTFIDCSTGDPALLEKLATKLHGEGHCLIEAPLSGSSSQIAAGQATMLLGGDLLDFLKISPVLEVRSTQQIHVGGAGMAARAKLATNLVLGLNRAALAEGMVFAQSMGIEPDAFLKLVLATPARSDAAVVKGALMVSQQFEPQSRIRQHLKDVQLMLDIAQSKDQELPLSNVHAQLLRHAVQAGDGELDNAAIVRQIRREKSRH